MSELFQLINEPDAKKLLRTFDPVTARRGEHYYRTGRVTQLHCNSPGRAYRAQVQGTQPYQVELWYDEEDQAWMGDCSCPVIIHCKHLYAVLKALLAEHSLAVVQDISAGAGRHSGPGEAGRSTKANFRQTVQAALGRPLARHEVQFLNALNRIYRRQVISLGVQPWDLTELGWTFEDWKWHSEALWPSLPQDEHEFWLHLAYAARQRGQPIPEFLEPVTDCTAVARRMAKWERQQEVQRWRQKLQDAQHSAAPSGPGPAREIDLRIRIDSESAVAEWKPPDQDRFERLTVQRISRLRMGIERGMDSLTAAGEFIWHYLQQTPYGQSTNTLEYRDADDRSILNRLIRTRALDGHVVDSDGRALRRSQEPLRWDLRCPKNATGDYHLKLVQADGSPPPPVLAALEGRPPLYLTEDAVFIGPDCLGETLAPNQDNRIPAPALETESGVAFLEELGLPLPERLAQQVERVPLAVRIECRLHRISAYRNTEECRIRVVASSPDGVVEDLWDGEGWIPLRGGDRRQSGKKRLKTPGVIRLYDRASVADVPAWMAPLGLKTSPYRNELALRVTKKFPELFLDWLRSLPPHVPVRLHGELKSFAHASVSGSVRLDVTEADIDWFDLSVVLDVSDTTLAPDELKLLLNAKGRLVRLPGKGWRRLEIKLTPEDDERLAQLGLSPRGLSAQPQRLHALQLAHPSANQLLPEQKAAQIQRRASELKARVTPSLPPGVQADLRPYQLEGFHFLAYLAANRFGGILADDMGLGKTLQTLAWLVWLRQNQQPSPPSSGSGDPGSPSGPESRPSLVVCPKSVVDNWQAEAARFTPSLRVQPWQARDLSDMPRRLSEADLHVINYAQLRSVGRHLAKASWLAVILDEGQYIKNPNSQTAHVARALPARHRLVLTGTPIENRLLDLWSLMAFAMPGALGIRTQFSRLYDVKDDPLSRRRLAARVRPFLLRRTKAQVAADLPDRIEEDLFCEIEGVQQTLYRAELKRAQQMLLGIASQQQLAKEQFSFLQSLLRLRQICCHPTLVAPDSKGTSAKVDALLEQIEPLMEEGHKVLVFSQFVEMLERLRPVLEDRSWPLFWLTGATENRGELVRQFQNEPGPAVFLISLKAGGFGLNLTAASYVILFDPWWNPAVENQAIDRTHRIGQTNKVIAYRLLIKNSVEEKIRALQKRKGALAEDVLGEEKFAQSLTLEDLRYLLAD